MPIPFVIWGLRDGFEIIMASQPQALDMLKKAEVVTDNMRQICQGSSTRFYSLQRNPLLAAATIYNTKTQDNFNRDGYIAITLYIPAASRFRGDVLATLNGMMDFYEAKQGSQIVNMFTEGMMREQLGFLQDEPAEKKPASGEKRGFLLVDSEAMTRERIEQVDIEGYRTVFLLQSDSKKIEEQLESFGYARIVEFPRFFRISLEGYNPSAYDVLQNGRPVVASAGMLHLEGLPGDELQIKEKKSGRQKKLLFGKEDQRVVIWMIFPQSESPRPSGSGPAKPKGKRPISQAVVVGGIFSLILLGLMGWLFWDDLFGGVTEKKIPNKGIQPPPAKVTITTPQKQDGEGETVQVANRDTTISIHKREFYASKVQLDQIKKTISDNGMECTIKGDTVFVTSKKPITLDSVLKLFPLPGKEDGAEKKETKKKPNSSNATKSKGNGNQSLKINLGSRS